MKKTVKFRALYWDIAADLLFPPDFDENKKYPTIISTHPIGSCKEQTSGNVYGQALADAGLWYWFRMHLSRVKVVENQDLSKTLHSV